MIRFIHCVKSRSELTPTEFRRFFQSDELATLTKNMATLTNAVDYKLSLKLEIQINLDLMQSREGAEPFDALIEVCWENGKELVERMSSSDFQALMDQMEQYQRQFVDFSRSSRFFAED